MSTAKMISRLTAIREQVMESRDNSALPWKEEIIPQLHIVATFLNNPDIKSQIDNLTSTKYCDIQGQCTGPECSPPKIGYPIPQWWQCSECGFGERESWYVRFHRTYCDCGGSENICGDSCVRKWFTCCGGGYFCYLYQCVLSPLVSWDCSNAGCEKYPYFSLGHCRFCKIGCPLTVTGYVERTVTLIDMMIMSISTRYGTMDSPEDNIMTI